MSVVASIANPEPVDSDPQPTLRIRTAIRCTASKPSGVRPEGRTTGASLGTNSVTGGQGGEVLGRTSGQGQHDDSGRGRNTGPPGSPHRDSSSWRAMFASEAAWHRASEANIALQL